MNDAVTIHPHTILRMIQRLVNFRYPQICRHLVATDLLNMLEIHGYPASHALADALVRADDEQAQQLLKEMLK